MRRKTPDRDYFGMDREDYLHAIYHLGRGGGQARISGIAQELKVRKPSASQMAERLAKEGYISYRPYRDITLTNKGLRVAQRVHARHEALAAFFTALGIPKRIQAHDIHGIEHYLSPMTLAKIEGVTRRLRAHKKL